MCVYIWIYIYTHICIIHGHRQQCGDAHWEGRTGAGCRLAERKREIWDICNKVNNKKIKEKEKKVFSFNGVLLILISFNSVSWIF